MYDITTYVFTCIASPPTHFLLTIHRPPPRGSILYHRLVRCGRKSTLCCAFSAARNCFAAAGQVLELIPVLVALNDKGALRNIAEAVEVEATVGRVWVVGANKCCNKWCFGGGVGGGGT